MSLTRRRFATSAGAGLAGLLLPGHARALDRALRETAKRAADISGTTLQAVATRDGTSGYRRLTAGAGWPLVVRTDLARPRRGRDERRRAAASFVQFTDQHLLDAQSPVRVEYLHPYIGAAHRPQETLTAQGSAALVARVNRLAGGPFTGRAFDSVVTTGDNTDNKETAELDWFLGVLNGGTVTPNTGASGYEGVQNSGSSLYWNPESAAVDDYKRAGFPQLPGFLAAALRGFDSPGLRVPWFSVFGNHDDSVQGTLPSGTLVLETLYTGPVKLIGLAEQAQARRLAGLIRTRPAEAARLIPELLIPGLAGPIQLVTPDLRRSPFTPAEYIARHLDPANTGSGPVGHGFGPENASGERAYYAFRLAPGVTGIALDSTNRAGFTDGSLGAEQFAWLAARLADGSSRYYDTDGNPVRRTVGDELFVVFSHHTSDTMDNLLPDPARPLERRHGGTEVAALLGRFPNVLAWVNGHSHQNRITPHRHADPARGFWEINTASHIDFPQQARIVEVADNSDGTLSLFTTLIEADAPYAASYSDTSARGLASLYRELAANDPHAEDARSGAAADRNTELLLPNPLGASVA